MESIKKIDKVVLLVIKKYSLVTVPELSVHLRLDKPLLYKSIKKLTKNKLLLYTNDRPKKYYIKHKDYKKWEISQ